MTSMRLERVVSPERRVGELRVARFGFRALRGRSVCVRCGSSGASAWGAASSEHAGHSPSGVLWRLRIQPQVAFKYQRLKKELEKEFPGKLEICGEGTPQVTGWFEVTVAGKLVHSKKNGDGFVDNDAKLHKIILAIKAALA
ncbi:hypothetical protein lerEdw1_009878 [Lerista edwardsae]|nr:hypothetical protein lerEdw1_009878 [Lerista edwardsae]